MVTTERVHVCDKHGRIPWDYCEQCLAEKCEHGTPASAHCKECSADTAWSDAPISDSELSEIKNRANRCMGELGSRVPSKPRNYTSIALLTKLLQEYEQLRNSATSA